MREMGFVVGHTNWEKMMDDDYADKALNRTKFI
jgi:YLP motif-containing protein 1